MRILATAVTFTLAAALPPTVSALTIFGYSPAVHDRFSGGYALSPVNNASGSFIGTGFDWSGVGWSTGTPTQSVALITPQNFVAASHFEPAVGTTLTFFGGDGALHNYTVSGYSSISYNGGIDDLAIGTLTAAIPVAHQVTYYPVLSLPSLPTFDDYLNRNLLVYGHGPTGPVIGTNTLDSFGPISLGGTNNVLAYQTSFSAVTGETQGQGGDSGGPTFTVFNGSLTVLGVHSAIATEGSNQYTYDSFIPSFISDINAILAGNGGYSITAIPEPMSTTALTGLLALAVCWHTRRRRCG